MTGPAFPNTPSSGSSNVFITDRPEQGFGQNSGLGLSISQQIMQVHRGSITAQNRLGPAGADGTRPVLGARFVVTLPAAAEA